MTTYFDMGKNLSREKVEFFQVPPPDESATKIMDYFNGGWIKFIGIDWGGNDISAKICMVVDNRTGTVLQVSKLTG